MQNYEFFWRYPQFKTRAVTLSFDDGYTFDREMVEILNRYGIKCTFNLNSGKIEGNEKMVQFEEFPKVYAGHEIACHSFTHPHLYHLDLGGITYEVIKDRATLEEKTGKIIKGFAYPFGLGETEGMIDCIKSCGIKYARTTNATHNFNLPGDYLRWNPTCHQADEKLYELAEKFFTPDDLEHPWRIRPLLFFIWGHSFEYCDNWESLEKMCKAVGNKENVWYATNMEIINYLSAIKLLERSTDGKRIYNPTDTDVYAVVNGKNVILKKGEIIVFE
jgi:hypothetical protein